MGTSSKIFNTFAILITLYEKDIYVSVCDTGNTNSINTFHVIKVEALINFSLFLEL
jgi:hypothetical protein